MCPRLVGLWVSIMTLTTPRSVTDLDQIDRRSRTWRRRQARRAEIIARLGGETGLAAHQRELVDLLLGLGQLVEQFQAKMAAGQEIDAERYLSAVKEQRRVIGELGLPKSGAPLPSYPPIRERLAAARA